MQGTLLFTAKVCMLYLIKVNPFPSTYCSPSLDYCKFGVSIYLSLSLPPHPYAPTIIPAPIKLVVLCPATHTATTTTLSSEQLLISDSLKRTPPHRSSPQQV